MSFVGTPSRKSQPINASFIWAFKTARSVSFKSMELLQPNKWITTSQLGLFLSAPPVLLKYQKYFLKFTIIYILDCTTQNTIYYKLYNIE